MCPSPPLPTDIDACSTDEELILFLGRRRVGDPTPLNVITEVDPFSIEPWDSPEETWFLYESKGTQPHSGESIIRVTKNGYWKYRDDIRISASTSTFGRKTTREFYIGQAPFGDRTGWTMHQYQAENIDIEGNNKGQVLTNGQDSSLCRLFLQFDELPNNEEECDTTKPEQCMSPDQCESEKPKQCESEKPEQCDSASPGQCHPARPELSDPVGVESMLIRFLEQEERNSLGGAANETQVAGEDEQRRLELSVGPPQDSVPPHGILNGNSEDDMHANYDFSKGDFLELKDLYDPESSSTSSDNSSLMSMNSDDYFDGEALLRDIENESNQNMDENRVDHRYNISTSVRSNQVVIRPPASGSAYNSSSNLVVSDSGSANGIIATKPALSTTMYPQSDCAASVSGSSEGGQVNETHSGSSEGTNSSRGSGSRSVRRVAKFGKKYCCFAPF